MRQKASAVGGGLTRAKKIHFRGFEVSGWKLFSSSLRSPYHSVNQTTHCVTRGTRAFPTGSGLEYRTEFALLVTQTYNKIESEDWIRKLVPLLRGSDCLIPLPNPQRLCFFFVSKFAIQKLCTFPSSEVKLLAPSQPIFSIKLLKVLKKSDDNELD